MGSWFIFPGDPIPSVCKRFKLLKIEMIVCLIYFLIILQLNQFDYLICFCLFSPCLQCGRMRKCGFLGAWKELTEMFPLQLDLFPRNILFHNHLEDKLDVPLRLQGFCLLSRTETTTERLEHRQQQTIPNYSLSVGALFLGRIWYYKRMRRLEDWSEVMTADCIAKQPLTFHEVQSCISRWLKLQFLYLEYKSLNTRTAVQSHHVQPLGNSFILSSANVQVNPSKHELSILALSEYILPVEIRIPI